MRSYTSSLVAFLLSIWMSSPCSAVSYTVTDLERSGNVQRRLRYQLQWAGRGGINHCERFRRSRLSIQRRRDARLGDARGNN